MDVNWTRTEEWDYYYSETPNYRYYEENTTGSFSSTSFAMALGGGLDVNVNDRFAIRLAQIDYLPTFHELKGKVDYSQQYWDYTDSPEGAPTDSYMQTETWKIPSQRYNNLRLSAGVVLKF